MDPRVRVLRRVLNRRLAPIPMVSIKPPFRPTLSNPNPCPFRTRPPPSFRSSSASVPPSPSRPVPVPSFRIRSFPSPRRSDPTWLRRTFQLRLNSFVLIPSRDIASRSRLDVRRNHGASEHDMAGCERTEIHLVEPQDTQDGQEDLEPDEGGTELGRGGEHEHEDGRGTWHGRVGSDRSDRRRQAGTATLHRCLPSTHLDRRSQAIASALLPVCQDLLLEDAHTGFPLEETQAGSGHVLPCM
eukprot:scaffold148_cov341-Pavlova_lutheri.AAC.37